MKHSVNECAEIQDGTLLKDAHKGSVSLEFMRIKLKNFKTYIYQNYINRKIDFHLSGCSGIIRRLNSVIPVEFETLELILWHTSILSLTTVLLIYSANANESDAMNTVRYLIVCIKGCEMGPLLVLVSPCFR